jgi:hypothetical protein
MSSTVETNYHPRPRHLPRFCMLIWVLMDLPFDFYICFPGISKQGINTRRVEAMEKQLKRDVLAEVCIFISNRFCFSLL